MLLELNSATQRVVRNLDYMLERAQLIQTHWLAGGVGLQLRS